jgi:electron transfer flavoprotein alpha subunit
MPNILAVAEQRDGALRKVSFEAVSAARKIADAVGGEVHVLVIAGSGGAAMAQELARYGADKVLVTENEAFKLYNADGYTDAVEAAAKGKEYFAVLFAASAGGKDLAPRVAARLDLPLATDATALDVQNNDIVITRPMFGGRAFAKVTIDAPTRLVSIRPNVFAAQENAKAGTVENVTVPAGNWRVKVLEVKAAAGAKMDVGEASIVVSGGRGLKGPENWHLLEELTAALGPRAALGASRAVVDAGWRPHGEQVGQTGKTVSPQLYFAVGISGAMQHLAGMRSARTIVAINKDPEAPIFKVADYGVVGDVLEILPRLTEEITKTGGVH